MKLREEKRIYVNQINMNDYYQQFYPATNSKKCYWK